MLSSRMFAMGFVAVGALIAASLAVARSGEQGQPKDAGPKAAAPARPAGPGPVHQKLAQRAGEYTIKKKISFPGQPPMEVDGHATITSILGGRFLREDNDGQLFGQPVASMMISGYNDETDRFEETWGWTGGNRLFSATGTSSDGGNTVHYVSSYDNGKGKTERLEIEVRTIDADHFVATFVEKTPDGKDGVTMESTYARRK